VEDDLAERAELHRARWTLLARHARTPEAIRAAEAYADSGPALSTYLRDRRDEAAAFALGLRAAAGYATETLPAWAELVARKPQHYGFRAQYAEALAVAGRHAEALATLEEGQRILRAAGTPRPDYMILAAEIELLRGDTAAAGRAAAALRAGTPRPPEHDPRWARVLAGLGDAAAARDALAGADSAAPAPRAEAAFTRGVVDEAAGQPAPAEGAFRAALAADPGHPGARLGLIRLLARSGRTAEARQARDEAARLPFPLGPDFRRDAEVALAAR
jgi:tetratricopeptide (TPR) repeat protein